MRNLLTSKLIKSALGCFYEFHTYVHFFHPVDKKVIAKRIFLYVAVDRKRRRKHETQQIRLVNPFTNLMAGSV